jgi:chorismate mutase/prephenate dehydratase
MKANIKTSLVVSVGNKPGALHRVLEPFATFCVDMVSIESRPSNQGLWDYVFFVDLEGHITDAHVNKALQECEERASMLKVLGSYPAAVI